MAKTDTYKQCKLQRLDETMVSWIPSKYAKLGKITDLKDENGNWTTGWRIAEVWSEAPAEQVEANRDEYRTHRKRTDI